jgi:hypothetical protein
MGAVWKSRNNIFNNVLKNLIEIVDEIKLLTWKCSVERLKIVLCHFYASVSVLTRHLVLLCSAMRSSV